MKRSKIFFIFTFAIKFKLKVGQVFFPSLNFFFLEVRKRKEEREREY